MKGEGNPFSNRRLRKSGHSRLLDVKARATTAKRQRIRKVWGWTWKLTLVAVIGAASYVGLNDGIRKFFFQNPEYTLHRITLDSDETMTHDEILQATGIREGQNVFSINLAKAGDALRAIPCVADVHIDRILPDQISVWLRGRKPVAWVTPPGEGLDPYSRENALFTDAAGQLFKPMHILPEYYRLPLLRGVDLANIRSNDALAVDDLRLALELLDKANNQPACLLTIRALDLSKGYCLIVTNDKGAMITFDTRDFDKQLQKARILIEHCQQTGMELKSANLMVQRNTPVTFVMADAPATPMEKTPVSGHASKKKLKND